MKYLCITFYLLSGFIYFIDAESFASPIHKSLYNALFCKNDSLETVRELEKQKGNLKKYGITYHSIGEDMDEVITIRLKKPITIHGFKTYVVKADFSSGVIVYGEFQGNYKSAIKKLKLKKGKTVGGVEPVAKYVNIPASKDSCPPTVGLEPKGKNKFILGCGWCNGG